MEYSESQETQLIMKFREKFGHSIPAHIGRWAANTNQWDRVLRAMEVSLEKGIEQNWEDYVKPSGYRSEESQADQKQTSPAKVA